MKKVRITMDGKQNGTHVYDADTGEEVKSITSLTITHSVKSPPMAEIVLLARVQESELSVDIEPPRPSLTGWVLAQTTSALLLAAIIGIAFLIFT